MLPLVIRLKKQNGQTQVFAFAESPIRIGRSPLNHLPLDEPFISRIEGVVRFDAKEVSYFNVGRTNVTLLDGKQVAAEAEVVLDERSVLVIGQLELRFSREAVDEAKLIRRNAKPTFAQEATPETLAATLFVSQSDAAALREPTAAPVRPAARPAAASPPPSPVPAQPGGIAMRLIPVGAQPQAREPTSAQPPRPEPRPAANAPSAQPAWQDDRGLRFSHAEYRRAWQSLLRDIEAELTAAPEHERAAIADRLQREYPQIMRENEFRELLGRLGLKPRKPGDPELERWLRGLGKGLFPPGVRLDTGMTLERLLALLQMFSQVFVEIQAAQNDACKEMSLQASGPNSLLSSEDPNVILAYLLNPSVDGAQRLAELEQCVTKLAIHEAALFGAIKDGAQALLESLSPEAVAQEEGRSSGSDQHLLARVFGSKQDGVDAKLWRRYAAMHADLMDGKRYQRRFIGREFARIYLRAMERLAPDL